MSVSETARGDIVQRMLGAARLDLATYEEIEADRGATGQAAFIVVATSIVAGVVGGSTGGSSLLGGVVAILAWAIQAWIVYFVGTRLFRAEGTRADWGEVARTIGFAQTPRFLLLLAIVPGLAQLVTALVGVWVLIASVFAIRAALDVDVGRAVATALVSALVPYILAVVFLAIAFGIAAG